MDESEGVIRQVAPADTEAILRLAELASGRSEQRSWLARHLASRACFVSESPSRVTGFVTVLPRSFFGRDFVESLVVDSEFRRSGIGSALLRASVSRSSTSQIFISTNRSNEAMLNLLRKERWRYSGELTGLDEGDPELVFYRRKV